MIEIDGKFIITNLLDEIVLDSNEIRQYFQPNNLNRAKSLEQFKRWKSRANKLIRQYVSDSESDGFWNLPTNMIYLFPSNQFVSTFAYQQINSHVEFVKLLKENIIENYTYFKKNEIIKWAYYTLMYLKIAEDKGKPFLNIQNLADNLGIPIFELRLFLNELLTLKLITVFGDFVGISLTENGLKAYKTYLEKTNQEKAEKNREGKTMNEDIYADNELTVLRKIYDMGKILPMNAVIVSDLAKDLRMPYSELNEYLNELEDRKQFISTFSDEAVKVTPKGKEFLQGKSNLPNNNIRETIYNTHINAPSINQIGGQHNTQNAQININSDLDNAIEAIIDLIRESQLNQFKKDDLISTAEHIKQLQSSEPSKELAEHAKAKIDYLGIAVKGTDLAIKISPYLPAIYSYFEKLISSAN